MASYLYINTVKNVNSTHYKRRMEAEISQPVFVLPGDISYDLI